MLIPKTRHEYYLNVISGNDGPTFPPKPREEWYLAKLAGYEVDVLIPKTPKERAYYNIINDIKFEPENRWQTFIAAANDDSITAPVPRTREETWWSNITLSQEQIVKYTGTLPATLRTVEGYLEDYKIYGNTVDGEGVGVETENLFDYVSYFASVTTYNQYFSCANIQLSPNTTYILSTNFHSGSSGTTIQSRETPFIVCNTVDSPATVTGGFGDDSSVSVTTADDGIIELYIRISRGHNPKELCDLPTLSDFENGKWVMLTEGSTAPDTYIPYGYKLPMISRAENLFDKDVYLVGGTPNPSLYTNYRHEIQLKPNTVYTMSSNVPFASNSNHLHIYTSFGSGATFSIVYVNRPITFTTHDDGILYFEYAKRKYYSNLLDGTYYVMLTEGSTAPDTYIPYHREETPVYIGDGQLMEGEYADYRGQKIYKLIDGTLTPTDPPVPLPKLPTFTDTNTVIDYEETPAPEEVELTYKTIRKAYISADNKVYQDPNGQLLGG